MTQNPDGTKTALLTKKNLRATDRDSFNPELTYQITTPPKHGDLKKLAGANVAQPITRFQQKDLDEKKVIFMLHEGGYLLSHSTNITIATDIHCGARPGPSLFVSGRKYFPSLLC